MLSAVSAKRPRWRSAIPVVTLLLMVATIVPGLVAGPASAGGTTECHWDTNHQYVCTHPGGPGGNGDDGGSSGGGSQPTCVLGGDYTFCVGTNACYYEPWHTPWKMPPGPKPSDDAQPVVRWCLPGGFGTFGPPAPTVMWLGGNAPQPPSLAQQAETAIGQIDLALPDLLTSPTGRSVVNLPTWFWLDGSNAEQVGTSAFGLRAIATVRDITVDTGDGSSITCPWVSSSAAAEKSCTYTYDRSSRNGTATWHDRPAYQASAHATWTLRFEMDGVNIVIPDAPATLDGPTSTAVLRVDEVQSVVTGAS